MNCFKLLSLPLTICPAFLLKQTKSDNKKISQSLSYYNNLTKNHIIVQKTNICENMKQYPSQFTESHIKLITESDNPFIHASQEVMLENDISEILQMKLNYKWDNQCRNNTTYMHISQHTGSINAVNNILHPKQLPLHIPMQDMRIYSKNVINIDMIFFDFEYDNKMRYEYECYLLNTLLVALLCNNIGGCLCIKISQTDNMTIITIIYILSQIYSSCFIIKPFTSHALSQFKYLVCCEKHDISTHISDKITNDILSIFLQNITDSMQFCISHNIPLSFVSKMEDINSILGKNQLNAMDKLSNILSYNSLFNIVRTLSIEKKKI